MAGLYKNSVTGVAIELIPNGNTLRVEGGAYEPVRQDSDALVSIGSHFEGANGERWTFDGQGGVTVTDRYGTVDAYQRVAPAKPTGDRLKGLLGTYLSDEVETAFTIALNGLNGETLVLERRPDELIDLRPVYDDAFDSDLGFVIFERNSNGRAIMLSLAQPRVWKLDFMRRDEPSGPAPRE